MVIKHLGLRVDPETYQKLKYISDFEGRSMNKEILWIIRQEIKRHESLYGKISFNNSNNNKYC